MAFSFSFGAGSVSDRVGRVHSKPGRSRSRLQSLCLFYAITGNPTIEGGERASEEKEDAAAATPSKKPSASQLNPFF